MAVSNMSILRELKFIQDNPQFWQRPASIREFVGPDYLNIAGRVRPAIMA
jgi:hypothetical protein